MLFAPSPTEWHEVQPPYGQPLLDVAWNGRTFLAVGRDGAVVSSSDGEHWQTEDSGVTASLRGIAWDGSAWVVVGDAGTVVRSTSQGTWRREPTPTDARLEAVAVGSDGTEVAVGPDVTLARWDGTWLEGAGFPHGFGYGYRTVIWTGDRFVAGGGDWGYGGGTSFSHRTSTDPP